ncbi:MAG: HigA family addiction module antitoxin [Planctomycetota bacterium]|jgi:HTH-type transcriptional regulator/antitoxin HigA
MAQELRPYRPIKPGEILKDELETRGWSQCDLAEILGRPIQAVNEIILGKKAIVPSTAVELSRAFGTSAEFWLNLESAYRLDLLHQQKKEDDDIAKRAQLYTLVPVKELAKRGWITNTDDIAVVEREICRLLEVKSIDETPDLAFAARKSDPYNLFNSSQVAWICRARQLARCQKVNIFNQRKLSSEVSNLGQLSIKDKGIGRVPGVLSELGVRFVIVEPLPQTYIDGAAFWLDSRSPVVALAMRYDRIDYFWFTLMHELAHIVKDRKHTGYLDNNLVGPSAESSSDKPIEEQEADKTACEWLIPKKDIDDFIAQTKPYFSKSAIVKFAEHIGVHPGIIVGRLQYVGEIPYSHNRGMLVKVRDDILKAVNSDYSVSRSL